MPPLSTVTTDQAWDDATSCSSVQPMSSSSSSPCAVALPTTSCAAPQCATTAQTTTYRSASTTSRVRKVKFSSSVGVRETLSLHNMPKEEVEGYWYTPDDFASIKKSLIVTIRLMMASKPMEPGLCSRGLECRTAAGAKLRKKNKLESLTAVWTEQVSQWQDERTDEEAIAEAYRKISRKCMVDAQRAGTQDEIDAKTCWDVQSIPSKPEQYIGLELECRRERVSDDRVLCKTSSAA